jgi:protoporphyrinogen oxidase
MVMKKVAVLGSGMAGWGAAYQLEREGVRATMYDQNSYYGGHTASFKHDTGFIFDIGPHISFTKDERIQALFAESVGGQYETVQINLNNYWQGYWPTHPVQLHLHGLPTDVVVKVIEDFVGVQNAPEGPIKTYADWLYASFGKSFSETFPMQYARKYHLTTADNMSTDWLGPRIYKPNLNQVLNGALSPAAPNVHYITHFRYPKSGGFMSYLNKFLSSGDLKLNKKLTALSPETKELRFADGSVEKYDEVVSSIPLDQIVPMIAGAPKEVLEAAAKLACSTCVLVNVGVDREDLSPAHMSYFYDDDICFTRLSFPHMLSKSTVPAGKGSIQAEVYFSKKYRPLTQAPESLIEPVIADLKKCGILREDEKILHKNAMVVPYANIIFDLDRAEALKTVHAYLADVGVHFCGRYGDWGYMWTDESFISGERAAREALAR